MIFLVDCGNTRLKWAEAGAGVWRTGACRLPAGELAPLLDQHWRALAAPEQAVICCVGGAARQAALAQWMRTHWRLEASLFQAAARTLDVVNGYHDPASLGADRWAALLGARGYTHAPACVVDCGTAVTVDALAANGEFIGGAIFPGLALLRASLAHGTAAVQPPPGSDVSCLGRSTADAVAGGTLFALAGAIERVLREQQAALGAAARVFLTGGDAPLLAAHIALAVEHVPDLVLQGLARFAHVA